MSGGRFCSAPPPLAIVNLQQVYEFQPFFCGSDSTELVSSRRDRKILSAVRRALYARRASRGWRKELCRKCLCGSIKIWQRRNEMIC
jgi:hypothetical protein